MESVLRIFTVISERENVTIGALEKMLGASKGVLSRAINKGTDVQSKWLVMLIKKFPNYNYDKMLRGEFSTVFDIAEEPGSKYHNSEESVLSLKQQLIDKNRIIQLQDEKIAVLESEKKKLQAG